MQRDNPRRKISFRSCAGPNSKAGVESPTVTLSIVRVNCNKLSCAVIRERKFGKVWWLTHEKQTLGVLLDCTRNEELQIGSVCMRIKSVSLLSQPRPSRLKGVRLLIPTKTVNQPNHCREELM